jgi:Peptidase family S41/N-terminal domain of Peptidase_S41 in eukaryotic IRBP
MSETFLAWLLRLYPARFRVAFGDEALQLVRDRVRHETGFLPKVRLWLDLLCDLAVTRTRERTWRATAPRFEGGPSLLLLPNESPRPSAILFGSLVSLVVLIALPFFVSHSARYRNIPSSIPEPLAFAFSNAQSRPHSDFRAWPSDAAARKRIIDAVIEDLNKYYVYPDVARKMAAALRVHEQNGDHDMPSFLVSFADLLTTEMQEVSHDQHLRLEYGVAPDYSQGPPPNVIARFRRDMEQQNCTFEKVEVLPHNIGYLKLNGFPDPSICQATALASMAKLNDASAIIFDLRDNHGGSPRMVALVASCLFDRPTHLTDIFTRPNNITEQSWTPPPVPGNKLWDKPAYVLTSSSTFSGGEEFPYDLKMLRRATLVGETTAGAAHLTSAHRIRNQFTFFVPSGRPINPVSKTDWEAVGVEPDVKVNAADALETAEKLAFERLQSGRSRK